MRRIGHTECNSNKTALLGRRVWGSIASDLHLNRSILKRCFFHYRQASCVIDARWRSVNDAQSPNALVGYEVSLHILKLELVECIEADLARGLAAHLTGKAGRQDGEGNG